MQVGVCGAGLDKKVSYDWRVGRALVGLAMFAMYTSYVGCGKPQWHSVW